MSTAAVFEYERDAIRVKARYYGNNRKEVAADKPEVEEETRKFSVDPNLTSYDTLKNLLARAFDLPEDTFRISYYCANEWLPMLSDWDLDAAVISASDPCLQLALLEASNRDNKINLIADEDKKNETTEDPNSGSAAQDALQQLVITSKRDGANFLKSTLPALTIRLQKALNMPLEEVHGSATTSSSHSSRQALSDREFRSFLDNVGELVRPREFRLTIYHGGCEPQLRKVVWKHLLGVYPNGLDGRKRLDYMRQKSLEYDSLKSSWLDLVANGKVTEDIKAVTNMVRKDVLRTDRQHKFYAGEANENVTALYNILTTFALHHPSVGYCQGMSDLLSPILMTMMDEAHAYVCFCALMQRLKKNFMADGVAMTKMFQHLSEGLTYYDPEFFAYLKMNQADDLLFCYRWLLLEMKREFAFEDSLQVLETLWASLPPTHADRDGLKLYEVKYAAASNQNETEKGKNNADTPKKRAGSESVYAKMVSLRRRTTSSDLKKALKPLLKNAKGGSPERPRVHSANAALDKDEEATEALIEEKSSVAKTISLENNAAASTKKITNLKDFNRLASTTSSALTTSIDEDKEIDDPFDHDISYVNGGGSNGGNNNVTLVCDRLPEPTEFGDGNPFLVFVCISCLLQHRNQIMNSRFDYQEIAMYFDKMVRKHDVEKTLALARKLFAEYLNDDWAKTAEDNNGCTNPITASEATNDRPSC